MYNLKECAKTCQCGIVRFQGIQLILSRFTYIKAVPELHVVCGLRFTNHCLKAKDAFKRRVFPFKLISRSNKINFQS